MQGCSHLAVAGNWALVIKRDIFDKVRGAVRSVPLLDTQALGAKIALALQAAATCRAAETASLQQALAFAQESFFNLLNATLLEQYTGSKPWHGLQRPVQLK